MDRIESTEKNKRLQSAIFLSVLVYLVWMALFNPNPVQQNTPIVNETSELVVENEEVVDVPAPVVKQEPKIAKHSEKFDTNEYFTELYSVGGGIHNIVLKEFIELPTSSSWWGWIFSDTKDGWVPYEFSNKELSIFSEDGLFIEVGTGEDYQATSYKLQRSDSNTVIAVGSSDTISIRKTYTKTEDPYLIDVKIDIQNISDKEEKDIWFGVADEMETDVGRFLEGMRPQFFVDGDLEVYLDLEDIKEEPEFIEGDTSWFGIGSRYFLVAASPTESQSSDFKGVTAVSFAEGQYGSVAHLKEGLKGQEEKSFQFTLYAGPKQLEFLETVSEDLTYAVDFGIFGFFSRILLFLLKIFYSGFGNWGISILLLTLFVKVIFYPMTQKGYISSRKMQAEMKKVQPELDEIKKKYKDDFMLQQQETQRVYKENEINPLSSVSSGCLPMLVQLPVWLALYNVMLYSVEIYDSSFLYLKDLTTMDPYGILPVLYGGLMIMSQKLTPMPANMDAAQMRIMKLMPLGFAIFMFTFPSGLVLYFCCNAFLTSFQQWAIRNQFAKKEASETTVVTP